MGFYINPADQSKDDFLRDNGVPLNRPEPPDQPDVALVCLVDSGPFTAAAIAYSRREMDEFSRPDDRRPKTWYWVDKAKLYAVSSINPEDFRDGP